MCETEKKATDRRGVHVAGGIKTWENLGAVWKKLLQRSQLLVDPVPSPLQVF